MKHKRVTDPSFKYVPAVATDIRKTFARVRRKHKASEAEAAHKVLPIKSKAK